MKNKTEKMKTLIVLILLSIIFYFDGLGQTNIRTRRSPPSNFPSVFDGNATSNAIMSRYNSYNAGANDIQNRINQVQEKLVDLESIDKNRHYYIGESISSFIVFLNVKRLDLSNSTNKRYVDNVLNEINSAIDKAFDGDEEIKIPFWIDSEEGYCTKKMYVYPPK